MKDKENLLIQSFLNLMKYKKIESISMRDIALEANVSLGLAYNYYPSKEKLVIDSFVSSSNDFKNSVKLDFQNLDKSINDIISYSQKNISVFYLLMYLEYCSFVSKIEVEEIKLKYCHILGELKKYLNMSNAEISYFILLPIFKYCIDLFEDMTNLDKNIFTNNLNIIMEEKKWKK